MPANRPCQHIKTGSWVTGSHCSLQQVVMLLSKPIRNCGLLETRCNHYTNHLLVETLVLCGPSAEKQRLKLAELWPLTFLGFLFFEKFLLLSFIWTKWGCICVASVPGIGKQVHCFPKKERWTILEQENNLLSHILLGKMMCLSFGKRMMNLQQECWEAFSML